MIFSPCNFPKLDLRVEKLLTNNSIANRETLGAGRA